MIVHNLMIKKQKLSLHTFSKIVTTMKENGRIIKEMEVGGRFGTMDRHMKDTGKTTLLMDMEG